MKVDSNKNDRGEIYVKQANDMLTDAISQMSTQDRNVINEEVHGVRVLTPKENPTLLQQSLIDLDTFLNKMVTEPPFLKKAYDLSQSQDFNRNPEPYDSQSNCIHSPQKYIYTNDINFRLRFLRCEYFDAEKAAIRIIKYLDLALDIFGEYALRRPILLSDFNKEEMKVLRSGFVQLLPYRDRAGRPILAFVGDLGFNYDWRIKIKIIFYMFYVAGGDVESQRKGIILVTWPHSQPSNSSFSLGKDEQKFLKRIFDNTSIRICAVHCCIPDTFFFRVLRPIIIGAASHLLRSRLKFFDATGVERHYVLKGYGIPTEIIPITDTGNIKTVFLKQWIKLRIILENEGGRKSTDEEHAKNIPWSNFSFSPIVEFPSSCDVLYRTGTTTSYHSGNAVFRELIEAKLEEFKTRPEVSFSMLGDELINEIFELRKGRFLKWDKRGYWVVMNDRLQINIKVTASIRDFKRLEAARKNLQSVYCSTNLFERQDLKRAKKLCSGNISFPEGETSTDATPIGNSSSCFNL